jgi:hypothetical protein
MNRKERTEKIAIKVLIYSSFLLLIIKVISNLVTK